MYQPTSDQVAVDRPNRGLGRAPILIVGASTRAAACSAIRAGFSPTCADQFADADLAALCPVVSIAADPIAGFEAVQRLFASNPGVPWFYTGPWENHPDLIDRLARRNPLRGHAGSILRRIRDPFQLRAVLEKAGVACPLVRRADDRRPLPRGCGWLVKPIASGGGLDVRPLTAGTRIDPALFYLQERVEGLDCAASFYAGPVRTRLIGVTRQIAGYPGQPFGYRGSVGPLPIAAELRDRLSKLGEVLRCEFGLTGLFGVDFILHKGCPWPVEVNPRYSASVEILELAERVSYLSQALGWSDVENRAVGQAGLLPSEARVIGKRIVFATRPIRFTETQIIPSSRRFDLWRVPEIADIPAPGTEIQAGAPVFTLFATADDESSCLQRLKAQEARWRRWLEQGPTAGSPCAR
jgi:predicted ATP-grasp superfamily ATP-dependent carboligase